MSVVSSTGSGKKHFQHDTTFHINNSKKIFGRKINWPDLAITANSAKAIYVVTEILELHFNILQIQKPIPQVYCDKSSISSTNISRCKTSEITAFVHYMVYTFNYHHNWP